MNTISLKALSDAVFCGQETEYHAVTTVSDTYSTFTEAQNPQRCSPDSILQFLRQQLSIDSPQAASAGNVERKLIATLTYIYQRQRARHCSRRPDAVPFRDIQTTHQIFNLLALPYSYLQIANGSLAVAEAAVRREANGSPHTLEFIVHCISKRGDWALALSHDAPTHCTSAFWSVESCIDDRDSLANIETMKEPSCHPMLLPCVMFAYILRDAIARRHAIKARLSGLERDIKQLSESFSRAFDDDNQDLYMSAATSAHIARLSDTLDSCRSDQGSREGRYHFWNSYYEAIKTGLQYWEEISALELHWNHSDPHAELLRWATLTWVQLQSLKTRDMDHVTRVNEASDMLYHLITQRDSRSQAATARASKRDNEDMRFMALLGSVFLPASLVATILNVPEFQFLPGAKLFGVYTGVTIPLIGIVVALCLSRRALARRMNRCKP